MSKIFDILQSKDRIICTGSVASDKINEAELKLKLTFADEYKEYVARLGCASFVGHELTGICVFERLNVVSSTIRCRQYIPDISTGWYVIEETNMDGIIIWQDADGAIYQTQPNKAPEKIAESLYEYVTGL